MMLIEKNISFKNRLEDKVILLTGAGGGMALKLQKHWFIWVQRLLSLK